jgi:hypothetical protein
MAKTEVKLNLGRVVLFRGFKATKVEDIEPGAQDMVEILDVDDVQTDYIQADRYVLPIEDATVLNSEDGLVYCYNVSLPYLQEIKHLAEVEKNIVIGQAFMYPGRNMPNPNKGSLMPVLLIVAVVLIAAFGIFK